MDLFELGRLNGYADTTVFFVKCGFRIRLWDTYPGFIVGGGRLARERTR